MVGARTDIAVKALGRAARITFEPELNMICESNRQWLIKLSGH